MCNFKQMIEFSNKLKDLEWTDNELLNLPEKYTKLMVHIALEKADNDEDKKNFELILNGNGISRRFMLLKHIEITGRIFTWNFLKQL